jgi:hypothetical protein
MSDTCRFEPHVRRAAVENQWTDALRDHVKSCADCEAAAAAAPFMTRIARIDERSRKLPDPGVVWLKAQLLRGTVIAERATRPLNVLQMIAYGVVAGGWAAVLTWRWNDLQRWILGFTPTHIVRGVTQASPLSITFLLTVVILATMTVILGLHTILAEE